MEADSLLRECVVDGVCFPSDGARGREGVGADDPDSVVSSGEFGFFHLCPHMVWNHDKDSRTVLVNYISENIEGVVRFRNPVKVNNVRALYGYLLSDLDFLSENLNSFLDTHGHDSYFKNRPDLLF